MNKSKIFLMNLGCVWDSFPQNTTQLSVMPKRFK